MAPILVQPTTHVHQSFLMAMEEFRAEGRASALDRTSVGREINEHGATWDDPARFAAFVDALHADATEHALRPAGHVPQTTLWYVDGPEYLGRLGIRHRLTPFLLDQGGHIGYDVRPSTRGRGHATRMLRQALPVAYGLGITDALVTCDTDNVGSRKVIEAAGGRFEDQRGVKLRYWVRTRPSNTV